MRKMKKILAWLTVLTVNVSMMPMPTVAAATATDASTALNEETITSDATKEATQAQETAKMVMYNGRHKYFDSNIHFFHVLFDNQIFFGCFVYKEDN